MKHILVMGAGKSASVLIAYLLEAAAVRGWHVRIADLNADLARTRAGGSANASAHGIDSATGEQADSLVRDSDLVISLLPPHLHIEAARLCLKHRKHFLNASYVTPEMAELHEEASREGLLFLCEMGLDPGIDHMSAMEMIDAIRAEGGHITSFRSHCGGLVAPESDNNPWHYKISWNPRNIVMSGKDGASFLQEGKPCRLEYQQLFDPSRTVYIPSAGTYAWYPNRDSLAYIPKYGLEGLKTFVRTTLRHPDFCFGWKNVVDLNLTAEDQFYDTDGMTLSAFFQLHLDRNGFSEWLQKAVAASFSKTREYLDDLIHWLEAEKKGEPFTSRSFLAVDADGQMEHTDVGSIKRNDVSGVDRQLHDASLLLNQLFFLGLDSPEIIDKGRCSAADILQWAMERKLGLSPGDKDMILMLHEIGYELDGRKMEQSSYLVVKGEDAVHTAMAKTVGLPLGIAATLLLEGRLDRRGVVIPVHADIYVPVLAELRRRGVAFQNGLMD
jgi:saccharopine dehydrogenase-like NADP-dependent oxidoreductase